MLTDTLQLDTKGISINTEVALSFEYDFQRVEFLVAEFLM